MCYLKIVKLTFGRCQKDTYVQLSETSQQPVKLFHVLQNWNAFPFSKYSWKNGFLLICKVIFERPFPLLFHNS